jgi:hypothetical protein
MHYKGADPKPHHTCGPIRLQGGEIRQSFLLHKNLLQTDDTADGAGHRLRWYDLNGYLFADKLAPCGR